MEISNELREQLLDYKNIEIALERAALIDTSTAHMEDFVNELIRVVKAKEG